MVPGDAPTFLSLFSGIGGFDLALERAGWRCLGQVEIDPFCARVLVARFPHIARWTDVREWQGDGHEPPDLLVGGFPCQDFSVAGKRAGLAGYRGTLFWEIVRIAKAFTPAWGLFENVPGLLSSHRGRDFWAVLQGLRDCWPAVGWRVLDSRYFGVPQCRRRVFLVCGSSEAAVASVLFEPEGGSGDPAAGGETLPHLTTRTGKGTDSDCTDGQIVTALRHLGSGGPEGGHLIVGPLRTNPYNNSDPTMEAQQLVAHALSAEGADASEDGTGQGTPLVIEMAHGANQTGIRSGSSYPVSATTQAVLQSTVRRLTPLECECLQAFPDGWTCLCQPLEAYVADPEEAAWKCKCPDGPRYRALGNAVTVSVVEWIGRRLGAAARC